MRRVVQVTEGAQQDLDKVANFYRNAVASAIDDLEHQADVETKHRHPMGEPYIPRWQVEVGEHRVYYRFDDAEVEVLAVRLKGKKRTEEVYEP